MTHPHPRARGARRPARSTPWLAALTLPLVLAACGTERPGTEGVSGVSGADDGTSTSADLTARARAAQTLPEHVHVLDAPGFDLAEQSVGVYGGDGFSSAYSRPDGAVLTLTVDRDRGRRLTAESCTSLPFADGAPAAATCTKEAPGWYRASEDAHAYVRAERGLLIQLGADPSVVDRATLRAAARTVHRADADELDAVLPPASEVSEPVERGDLPSVGDGAPNNEVGVSG